MLISLLPFLAVSGWAKQDNECYPKNSRWPVTGIFVHGNIAPGDDFGPEARSDQATILEVANRLHVRIAVPLGPLNQPNGVNGATFHAWSGATPEDNPKMPKLVKAAAGACDIDPSEMAKKKFVIGYSNGGFVVSFVEADCDADQSFLSFISIGAPGQVKRTPCFKGAPNRLFIDNRHDGFHLHLQQILDELEKRGFKIYPISPNDPNLIQTDYSKKR